jgi:hypothetical protein
MELLEATPIPYKQEVDGSIPSPPTIVFNSLSGAPECSQTTYRNRLNDRSCSE